MKLLLILLLSLLSSVVHAQLIDGQDRGNGGDLCELRIAEIRNDLQKWISKEGAAGLQLPSGISLKIYNSSMLEQMSKATFRCMREIPAIGYVEKTCTNYVDARGVPNIDCNYDRFMNANEAAQYVLIHHEYAGLAKFEVNTGVVSDYRISSQVANFLKFDGSAHLDSVVSNECPKDPSLTDPEKMSQAVYTNDLSCIRLLASTMSLNESIPISQWGPFGWSESLGYVINDMPPLAFAAALDHTEAIKVLLDAGAYIHTPLWAHYPVSLAAKAGSINAVKLLIQRGAFVNYPSDTIYNPLFAALSNLEHDYTFNRFRLSYAESRVYQTVQTLLSMGADPNILNFGKTPLSVVAERFELVDLLLEYGALPTMLDVNGRTPIFSCRTKACVDKFGDLGIDVNTADLLGNRPIDIVETQDAIDALLSRGSVPRTQKIKF